MFVFSEFLEFEKQSSNLLVTLDEQTMKELKGILEEFLNNEPALSLTKLVLKTISSQNFDPNTLQKLAGFVVRAREILKIDTPVQLFMETLLDYLEIIEQKDNFMFANISMAEDKQQAVNNLNNQNTNTLVEAAC